MFNRSTLSSLLADFVEVPKTLDCKITGLALDSRCVKPGDLFCAYSGDVLDGCDFVQEAIDRWASRGKR